MPKTRVMPHDDGMIMVGRILWRLLKSCTRVLLVGWTPKPPPDFETRLIEVEKLAERTRQKVYRDGKATMADVPDLSAQDPPAQDPPADDGHGAAVPAGWPPFRIAQ